jgi:hypothetical protein
MVWRLPIAGAAAALALCTPVAPAQPIFKTRITVSHVGPAGFQGTVASWRDGCISGRTIEIGFDRDGPIGDADPAKALQYTEVTDAHGEWDVRLTGNSLSGHYRLKVKRKRIAAGICEATFVYVNSPPRP